ncbi:MAG: hypothetical protein ACRD0A_15435 [Acidimicrobiales bacterium]
MSNGAILRWTALRVPGVDDRLRPDMVVAVDAIAARGSRIDRAAEVASLVGFALRSMSRRGAFDDRRELIRQGLRVGALVLAIVNALLAGASAEGASSIAVGAGAVLTASAIAGGLGLGAVLLAGGTVLLQAATTGPPSVSSLVVLGAVAVGHRFDARRCPVGGAVCAAAVIGGCIGAALLPAPTVAVIVTPTILTVAIGLLAMGWFDPRYAVAATLVWFWRFIAVDIDELGRAMVALGDRAEFQLLVGRWLVMGAGVVFGWRVTEAAIRRCLTVFD